MKETWVWSLNQEDPTCRKTPKPVCHNYRACALEFNYWSPCALEAMLLQQEKPMQ